MKLKVEIENVKKEAFHPELSVAVNINRGNLNKIFKFIEPKFLKNLENKLEELTVFLNENLKIIVNFPSLIC